MTNRKPLIDKLLHNWPAKVVCLIVAIFLYIFHQASLVDKKTIVVPLKIVENGIVMHVGNVPSSVSVIIRANSNDINTIHNSDISASVNLDTITEKGRYKLPVNISIADRLFEMDPLEIKLRNETIVLDVDRKAMKYVDLNPSMVGEVAHGYKISSVSINPSAIEVYGPESVLNAVGQLQTTKINVSNAETTFTTEIFYIETSSILEVNNNGPYRATVIVSPIDHEADFSNIQISSRYLNENLYIIGSLPAVSVKLAGSMKALEEFVPMESFAQIDLSEISEPGEYDLPVIYNIPPIFDLIEKSDSVIKVIIANKEEESFVEEDSEGNVEAEYESEKLEEAE